MLGNLTNFELESSVPEKKNEMSHKIWKFIVAQDLRFSF